MGNTYSISRVGSFDKCRLQYKYRYIDKVPLRVETIEAFMGTKVHETLNEFYDFIKNKIVKPKDWLLSRYEEIWKKDFSDSIKIVKKELSAKGYHQKGKESLAEYYDEYKPFDQTKIVKTEESIYFNLKKNKEEHRFVGILDRIDWNDKAKIFEIHDYKTSGSLMTQEEADHDYQLPLYQLALMSQWPEAVKTKLVWHFLLFNKQIESSRTQKQLEEVQELIIEKIKAIEACQEFPPFKSALCDWCDFQEICPLWKHIKKVEILEESKYRKDSGVKLVAAYSELEEKKKQLKEKIFEIEQEQDKIAEAAIEFAERENIQVIDGPDKQLVVTLKEELTAPTRRDDQDKWEGLRESLIESDKYIEVSTVNSSMLNRMMKSWPQELVAKIKDFLVKKVIRKVDLRKKN
ncbi:MAG: PD-(D/E)XK nuclease family protein [Candidatus Aminicenantes bacterium]|nr:PD-(D/E)XK nuclease family protein [Candidatus Aminicenantes bacterium]